jgi:hypothetical protein
MENTDLGSLHLKLLRVDGLQRVEHDLGHGRFVDGDLVHGDLHGPLHTLAHGRDRGVARGVSRDEPRRLGPGPDAELSIDRFQVALRAADRDFEPFGDPGDIRSEVRWPFGYLR